MADVSKFSMFGQDIFIKDTEARNGVEANAAKIDSLISSLSESTYAVDSVIDYNTKLAYIAIIAKKNKVAVNIVNNNGSYTSGDAFNSVYDFMQTATADVAFNCDYFPSKMMLNGTEIGDTDRWNVLNYLAYNPSLNDFKIYPKGTPFSTIKSEGYTTCFGVSWQLLNNGNPVITSSEDAIDPRTTFGWNDDYFVVVVNLGRQSRFTGITPDQQRTIMGRYGCKYAVNLDGGGSSQLCVKIGNCVVNVNNATESDGSQRKVPLNINFTEV